MYFIVLNVFSVVIFLSSIYRANQKYTIAQLATNGWKIVVVALFFILFQDKMLQLLVISLAFIAILLIGLYLKNFRNIPSEEKGNYNFKELRKTGLAFFLHNMTLTSAIYGEQFIINLCGNETISSELFMYFAVFSPIILSANGFIGFIIGPKLRAKKEIFRSEYNKLQVKLLGFAIVMSLISLGAGILLLDWYKGIPMNQVNVALVICVLICCVIRTVYTASSLYLGVFGSNKHLYKTAGLNWGALIGYITLVLLSLISNIAIEIIIVVIASLTTLHWLIRLIISHSYAVKVFIDEKN
ncbi:MAG: hypothetical protein HRT68_17165 [Flavobacteriaceae bacterium]|nr:hypothetical protein [Flavobacteriaceae bacterium]